MADAKTSKDGIWVDTRTGKVVDGKAPVEASQLVPPGGVITDEVAAAVKAAKDAEAGVSKVDTVTTGSFESASVTVTPETAADTSTPRKK